MRIFRFLENVVPERKQAHGFDPFEKIFSACFGGHFCCRYKYTNICLKSSQKVLLTMLHFKRTRPLRSYELVATRDENEVAQGGALNIQNGSRWLSELLSVCS